MIRHSKCNHIRLFILSSFIVLALSGKLCVADDITLLTEDTPPVNYLDENNMPAGLSVELVKEMAKRVGDPGQIQVVPWARGYKDAREKPNTALFSTTRTPDREPLFKWVGPLLNKEVVLYKKKGNDLTISTIDDAKKVGMIGAYKDDSKEQLLKKKGFTNLDSSSEDTANPKKLVAGRIDLWISTTIQAGETCKLASVDPAEIEPTLTLQTQQLYLAFSKSTEDTVVTQWQRAFDEMVKDGTAARIRAKYGIDTPTVTIYTEDTPFRNYVEDGIITGYATEIVREMLKRAGHADTIEIVTWARGYSELLERPNVALYSTVRNQQREELFHWVGPVCRNGVVFFAKKGSGIKITSLDEAKKVNSIGTCKYDAGELLLKEEGFDNLDSVLSNEVNPKKLVDRRIDLWLCAEEEGSMVARKAGVDPEDIEAIFDVKVDDLYVAISKHTNSMIVSKWQKAIDSMYRDGSLDEIMRQWKVTRRLPSSTVTPVSVNNRKKIRKDSKKQEAE